ncbi:MAG: hypothetical protein J6K03_01825 [Oscillospiraceae bacterium]|nr:hypothetical protein [Oscillospiraceae bacterium]
MKRYLLPEGTNYYKANLHCHSTVSDGKLTPEEIKQAYMKRGYSIVAFTDHEIMVPHPELASEDFLPLNGYEYAIMEDETEEKNCFKLRKCCHMCLIALEPDNRNHVCWHGVLLGNAKNYASYANVDPNTPLYKRVYSGEGITEVMQEARKAGFFVTYNHPAWSMEDMVDVINYHGMHALEIYNTGSYNHGWEDYQPAMFDAMLRRGKEVYCIAADDNHSLNSMFGGWTMICADKLEYRTITKALQNGHFYASTGPEIKALWFEDGNIHIECSPAAEIQVNYGSRRAERYKAADAPLTEADIPVEPNDFYVRITVTDANGGHANTNPYYTKDLF